MKHILLTRYNLKTAFSGDRMTDKWLDDRYNLLKDFTAESVRKAKKPDNFDWIILIDPDTIDKRRIRQIADTVELKGCTSENIDHLNRLFACKRLVTSRLDSDDAIEENYLTEVNKTARDVKNSYIDLVNGYKLIDGKKRKVKIPSNCFLSKVSTNSTVFDISHDKAQEATNYTMVDTEPLWIMNIHGGNVSNR